MKTHDGCYWSKRGQVASRNIVHRILRNELHLRRIVAWAYEPELKCLSREWRHAESPRRQKVCQNHSPVKLMVIVAYDVRGVIVYHFVPHGRTVTTQYYRIFLVRKVRRGVWDKRLDLVSCWINDSARQCKIT
ncbi:uncharacterized protein TNCV_3730001 [Trichonephila clavipes]|nr:uncharacterized protein TNCV_3730001 [Trichonephila clavipes]